ncbi:MAG: Rieske (2Fe-2S) protein [Thermoplasmata archaeon]|uniref:Rieske (2Fe-2S) protein n=1 Tax=Candidatus Sysuiplasma superficiale TaxID=2823368 RepID=A0A8J7YQ53_9ARCH|nr:Rieske (2Fe-2S) protein [Candidatus Sysuiplasma superficiale]MBX8643328.1 Rieske (2Fe-2S) protein [Candidatus Sysuiplasma superficiale]
MTWYRAAQLNSINQSGLLRAEVGGKEILLIRSGNNLYATSLRCTHENDDLSSGTLEDGNIVCGFHFATYSPATGEVISPPQDGGEATPLKTYRVKIEGEDIMVEIP